MKQSLLSLALVAVVSIGLSPFADALETTVVTFDNGVEGWYAGPDCQNIVADGGSPGALWNFANNDCDGVWTLRAWFSASNNTDPAFIGDYTAKGPVRISIDVNVNDYTYRSFFGSIAAEEFRQIVVELIDFDNPYVDPDNNTWPWTSAMFPMGYFQNREDGWKTFTADIEDPNSAVVPAGWFGYGGPEHPTTYMPQLPPDRTFAELMTGIDEIRFHSIEPGYFYGYSFTHDIDFDNITIQEMPRECAGQLATVWVDNDGFVNGGEFDGLPYDGQLTGTHGDDVIVGTNGDDSIQGHRGNDVICGRDGNDAIHGHFGDDFILGGSGDDNLIGQKGNDFLDGGEGYDHINGGQGDDTCIRGENFQNCAGMTSEDNGFRIDNRERVNVIRKTGTSVANDDSNAGTTVELKSN